MGYTQSRAEEESLFIQNISRTCIFLLFVSQNAFVQLLFTQHWAFLGSLGKGSKDGSAWFAPVAGIGSVSSTLAASAVGSMADAFSLPGLLLFAAVIMLSSGVAADFAYAMAEKVRVMKTTKYEFCLTYQTILYSLSYDFKTNMCDCIRMDLTHTKNRSVVIRLRRNQLRRRFSGSHETSLKESPYWVCLAEKLCSASAYLL